MADKRLNDNHSTVTAAAAAASLLWLVTADWPLFKSGMPGHVCLLNPRYSSIHCALLTRRIHRPDRTPYLYTTQHSRPLIRLPWPPPALYPCLAHRLVLRSEHARLINMYDILSIIWHSTAYAINNISKISVSSLPSE